MNKNLLLDDSKVILSLIPKRLISFNSYFWSFPLSIVFDTYLIPFKINGIEEGLKWLVVAVLAHISMLPFVLYSKDKIGYSYQIPLLLMMGTIRGGVLAILIPLFELLDPLQIIWRIINSMISVFYWFLIAAIFIEFKYTFRKELTKKIQEVILKDAHINQTSKVVDNTALLMRINQLQKKIMTTLNDIPSKQSFEARAKDIDLLVRKHVRPLSKSQWKNGELVWASMGPIKIIIETLRIAPFYIWSVAFLTLPYTLIIQYNKYGVIGTLVSQAAWLISALLVQKVAKIIRPSNDGDYLQQNLIILILILTVITPIIFSIHGFWTGSYLSFQYQINSHILGALAVIFLLISSSIIISLEKEKYYILEILKNAISEKEFQRLVKTGKETNFDSKYAQYLHAEVQAQLLACKLMLIKAAESEFTLLAPNIIEQINERLEQIQIPYVEPKSRVPSERVEELVRSWTGLCDITFEFTPEMSVPRLNDEVISQLIEESVVNSIRHGKAKKIHIQNLLSEGHMNFIITDNGRFEKVKSEGGLGTILFNTFTESWSLDRDGDRTILKFSVKI